MSHLFNMDFWAGYLFALLILWLVTAFGVGSLIGRFLKRRG